MVSWKAFSLPQERELEESETKEIQTAVEQKLVELTKEDPDETLVEFLLVMLSNHNSFGEIATQLDDVSDGEYASELCEWLVGKVKEILKLQPSAEEQLELMRAQVKALEAKNQKLEEKINSGNDTNEPSRDNLERGESKKRKAAEQHYPKRDSSAHSVAVQYAKFLESGFQGDFAMYRDSLKDPAEQEAPKLLAQQAKESTTPNIAPAPTFDQDEITQRQKAMTWSRFDTTSSDGPQGSTFDPSSSASEVKHSPVSAGRGRGRGRGGFTNKTFVRSGLETQGSETSQDGSGSSSTDSHMGFGHSSGFSGVRGGFGSHVSQGRGHSPVFANMTYQRNHAGAENAEEGASQGVSQGVWGAGAISAPRGRGGFGRGRGRGGRGGFQNQQWVRPSLEQTKSISESLPSTP